MSDYLKRLIEVDLPIKYISEHARREKAFGPISKLHIWWARRPLAACRAVLCAALWPDPADELCPPAFRNAVTRLLPEFAEKVRQDRALADLSPVGWHHWSRLTAASWAAGHAGSWADMRYALLAFIADFSNWSNAENPLYLHTSEALTIAAYEAMGGQSGKRPIVADSFAGGGAIPLEALRVGADSFGSDLNPVAVLLNKVVLEYAPIYGQRLSDEVLKWGQWIRERALEDLGNTIYISEKESGMPIAYLWARTVISEAPNDNTGIPIEVPLVHSFWLAKTSKESTALRWAKNADGTIQTTTIRKSFSDNTIRDIRIPLLEVFQPKTATEVQEGTMSRSGVTCPVTGYTTPISSVRRQLVERHGGTNDARMLAIVSTQPTRTGREFRVALEEDRQLLELAKSRLSDLESQEKTALSLLPSEPTPMGGGSGAGRAFSQRNYGITEFHDFFNARQSLALVTLTALVRELDEQLEDQNDRVFALAVKTCLALAIGRQADHLNSGCAWNPSGPKIQHLFARPTLPIVWDFAEANPFGGSVGDWYSGVELVAEAIQNAARVSGRGHAMKADATRHPLPNDTVDLFFTDPPYYDAVPYADLSDFLYVWLRRALQQDYPELMQETLTPKDEECIVDEVKGKDHLYFENAMTQAMVEGSRITTSEGIGIVVFAHKNTSSWESLLKAMIDAGWTVTASWPIDTEHATRLRAMQSAALASSVHLVCRPRDINSIGDWRDVLQELPGRIHEWLPRLAKEGVVGADAIFACIGPALEVFSRYSSVERADGEVVTLGEYLEQVWAAVSREALAMIFAGADTTGFEEDARLTAAWLWTLSAGATNGEDVSKEVASTGYTLEYDAARKIAQGLGAHLEQLPHLIEVKGSAAVLLPVSQRTRYLFGKEGVDSNRRAPQPDGPKQLSWLESLPAEEAAAWAVPEASAMESGKTTLDRIHQSMLLFAAGKSDALKRFLVDDAIGDDERFWRLAQALSALYPPHTEEKRWVDGVLARKKSLGF